MIKLKYLDEYNDYKNIKGLFKDKKTKKALEPIADDSDKVDFLYEGLFGHRSEPVDELPENIRQYLKEKKIYRPIDIIDSNDVGGFGDEEKNKEFWDDFWDGLSRSDEKILEKFCENSIAYEKYIKACKDDPMTILNLPDVALDILSQRQKDELKSYAQKMAVRKGIGVQNVGDYSHAGICTKKGNKTNTSLDASPATTNRRKAVNVIIDKQTNSMLLDGEKLDPEAVAKAETMFKNLGAVKNFIPCPYSMFNTAWIRVFGHNFIYGTFLEMYDNSISSSNIRYTNLTHIKNGGPDYLLNILYRSAFYDKYSEKPDERQIMFIYKNLSGTSLMTLSFFLNKIKVVARKDGKMISGIASPADIATLLFEKDWATKSHNQVSFVIDADKGRRLVDFLKVGIYKLRKDLNNYEIGDIDFCPAISDADESFDENVSESRRLKNARPFSRRLLEFQNLDLEQDQDISDYADYERVLQITSLEWKFIWKYVYDAEFTFTDFKDMIDTSCVGQKPGIREMHRLFEMYFSDDDNVINFWFENNVLNLYSAKYDLEFRLQNSMIDFYRILKEKAHN